MAQSTLLAAAKTVATSTDLAVEPGDVVTIGVFTDATGGIPPNEGVKVYQDTPSADQFVFSLDGNHPIRQISAPGTYRAVRAITTTNVGVFAEAPAAE
jgi:hypothetical protein